MSRQDTEPEVMVARPPVGDEPGPVGYFVPASVYRTALLEAIRLEKIEHTVDSWKKSWNYWEQERRRGDFLYALNNYVPKRPRTYADRKWLEGYCTVAGTIRNVAESMRGTNSPLCTIQALRKALSNSTFKPTAALKGSIDAWLDSVGC